MTKEKGLCMNIKTKIAIDFTPEEKNAIETCGIIFYDLEEILEDIPNNNSDISKLYTICKEMNNHLTEFYILLDKIKIG